MRRQDGGASCWSRLRKAAPTCSRWLCPPERSGRLRLKRRQVSQQALSVFPPCHRAVDVALSFPRTVQSACRGHHTPGRQRGKSRGSHTRAEPWLPSSGPAALTTNVTKRSAAPSHRQPGLLAFSYDWNRGALFPTDTMSFITGAGNGASPAFLGGARRSFHSHKRMRGTMFSHRFVFTEQIWLRSGFSSVLSPLVFGTGAALRVKTAPKFKGKSSLSLGTQTDHGSLPCVDRTVRHNRQARDKTAYRFFSSSASSSVVRAFANVDPESLSAAVPHTIRNLVQGEWRTTEKTYDVVDPLNGEVFIKSPFTQVRRDA